MANPKRKSRDWMKDEHSVMQTQRPQGMSMPSISDFMPMMPMPVMFADMERMFNSVMRGFPGPWMPLANSGWFKPNVDIAANAENYTVTIEMPGVEEKDVRLEVEDNGMLTIRGEKRQENIENRNEIQCMECAYGTFERSISLPEDVELEAIDAHFRNGVLTVICPRVEQQKRTRRIPIGTGSNADNRTPANHPGERAKKVA